MGQLVKQVKNNADKQLTYRVLLGRYKKALNNGFNFVAMIIVYAMLEDRLRSFLFYSGAFRQRNAKKLNVRKTKKQLRNIYFGSPELASEKKMSINKISVKIELIRKIIEWINIDNETSDDVYLKTLKTVYESCLDLDGILETLNNIDNWRQYRNEIIHSVLNRNIDWVNSEIKNQVEEGMLYARFIDSQVKLLKRKNNIRVKMNIKE